MGIQSLVGSNLCILGYGTLLLVIHQIVVQGLPCTDSSVKRFGENCKHECHCLNDGPCNKSSGRCKDDLCSHGWIGLNCSIPCVDRYGSNCINQCHCLPSVECSPVNGVCKGSCHPDWGGPSCQIHLPKLIKHPTVQHLGCGEVLVTWDEWDENNVETSTGTGSIKYYSLYYWSNDTSQWTEKERVSHRNGSGKYTVNFTLPEGTYKFRVDTYRYKDPNSKDKKVYRAPPGIDTEKIHLTCPASTTTTKPVPTVTPVPRYIKQLSVTNVSHNTATVVWTFMQNVTSDIADLTLIYQHLSEGECVIQNVTNTTREIPIDSIPSFVLDDLISWSTYRVTLELVLENLTETANVNFETASSKPTVVPHNLRAHSITSSSFVLTWEQSSCHGRGGKLLRYDIKARLRGDALRLRVLTSNSHETRIARLQPYTTYSVCVRFVNDVGAGNYSRETTVQTLQGIPDPPANVTLEPAQTSITVTWDAPSVKRGVIHEYRVNYQRNGTASALARIVDGSKLTVQLQDLLPASLYFIQVSARTLGGWSNVTEGEVNTKPPSAKSPTGLRPSRTNESCISLAWDQPTPIHGQPSHYMITYQVLESFAEISDQSKKHINTTDTQEQATLCGLHFSSLYRVTISLITDDIASEPASIDIWTEIGSPAKPKVVQVIDKTNTTISLQFKAASPLNAPLLFYRIMVSEIKTRKKRGGEKLAGYTTAELTGAFVETRGRFVVGDGNTYHRHRNYPLKNDTTYDIALVVLTHYRNITKQASVTVRETTLKNPAVLAGSNSTLLIVLLVIFFVIVIIILAVVLFICYRKRRPYKDVYATFTNKTPSTTSSQSDDAEKYWSKTGALSENRHIVAGRNYLPVEKVGFLKTHPPRGDISSAISFHKEFCNLPHSKKPSNVAKQLENKSRNRFDHLLPYDQSRVQLKADENSNNLYINASYIDGVRRKHAYIAAQSPFNEETVLDFWRLIYQRKISVVVMITKLEEEEIIRCTQFWPDDNNVRTFVNFVMKVEDSEYFANFVVRRISITGRSEKSVKTLVVLHYKSWPEHGVPQDSYPFLQFRQKVRSYTEMHETVLVHCGTGVGRTAVYIAVDALLDQYEMNGEVSVYQFVKKMRENRIGMVRTFRQYVFIYQALFEFFCGGRTNMPIEMKDAYRLLMEKNINTSRSYLKDQFLSLKDFTPNLSKQLCRDSLSLQNVSKSRYLDVIPPDIHRPTINTLGGIDRTDYINAVFLDSYQRKNAFIATQSPLSSTVTDFWKLVNDYNITTIVMMESVFESADSEVQYWPNDLCTISADPYQIESIAEPEVYCFETPKKEVVVVRSFKFYDKQHPRMSPRDIKQFHFKAWNGTRFVPESKTQMLDMSEVVKDWVSFSCANGAPVLVHCPDGATQSGLYCAVSVVCETILAEGEVDVYHVVKSMKRRRPQIIDQLEQYRFLYKILWDFINLRMSREDRDDGQGHDNKAFSSLSFYSSLFDDLREYEEDDAQLRTGQLTFDLYSDADDHLNGHVYHLYDKSHDV